MTAGAGREVGAELPRSNGSQPVFSFQGVGVTFGEARVLHALDVDVPASGVTVVLGRSGSGKSTMTRLCNRLLDPTAGVVRFRGVDVSSLDVLALRRAVGMVFQRPTVFAGTVADNLAASGVTDRTSHARMLDRVGLDARMLAHDAATLSGGESQRVCLGRALLMQPQVLVADEPTASLDEPATRELETLACAATADGVPVLWVTHDLAQFDRIADHGVVLGEGTVIAAGSADSLRTTPGGIDALLGGGAPDPAASDPRVRREES